ncbi:MAG: glycosyl hydrolase family 18 protein, partial [Bacteroidota bacterium]|nr:glycosyl hydrolase family 18 protein [Bacteroidota bacterium]
VQNPDLKIVISVGRWTWSKHFSDAVPTDTATRNFAYSAVDIVARYGIDGIDIDWEYPGMMGDSNVYRPEDKEHYTNLFKDLRQMLDALGRVTGKTYLVTTAAGGSAEFKEHTQMNLVQLYTDYPIRRVPGSIAFYAFGFSTPLVHLDGDFNLISKHSKLKTRKIPT